MTFIYKNNAKNIIIIVKILNSSNIILNTPNFDIIQ